MPSAGGYIGLASLSADNQATGTFMSRYDVNDEPVPGYLLVDFLGGGNIGKVWKATAPGGVQCALKIIEGLHNRGGRKELRSLQLVKNLAHPNLVPIFGIWLKNRDGEILMFDTAAPEFDSTMPSSAPSTETEEIPDEDVQGTMAVGSFRSPSVPDHEHDREKGITRETEEYGPPLKETSSLSDSASELIIAMGLGDKTLEDRLDECRRSKSDAGIPREELLKYLSGAAEAIDVLHEQGIQHCDIKPRNILIIRGAAQVCDFGLAQAIGPDTRQTTQAYTPAYGDPIVLGGGKPVDSTDLYCLAVTYVELRTGKLPFPTDNFPALFAAKQTGKLQIDDLPECERPIIRRALSPTAEKRTFQDCTDFIRQLEESGRPLRSEKKSVWITSVLVAAMICLVYLVARPFLTDPNIDAIQTHLENKEFVAAASLIYELPDNSRKDTLLHDLVTDWYHDIVNETDGNNKIKEVSRLLSRFGERTDLRAHTDRAWFLKLRILHRSGNVDWPTTQRRLETLDTTLFSESEAICVTLFRLLSRRQIEPERLLEVSSLDQTLKVKRQVEMLDESERQSFQDYQFMLMEGGIEQFNAGTLQSEQQDRIEKLSGSESEFSFFVNLRKVLTLTDAGQYELASSQLDAIEKTMLDDQHEDVLRAYRLIVALNDPEQSLEQTRNLFQQKVASAHLDRVQSAAVERLQREVVLDVAGTINYPSVRSFCQAIKDLRAVEPVIDACWIEAQVVEAKPDDLSPQLPDSVARVAETLPDSDEGPQGVYFAYVRALADYYGTSRDLLRATSHAKDAIELYVALPKAAVLNVNRRQQLMQIKLQAVEELLDNAHDLTAPAFTQQHAQNALQLLAGLEQIMDETIVAHLRQRFYLYQAFATYYATAPKDVSLGNVLADTQAFLELASEKDTPSELHLVRAECLRLVDDLTTEGAIDCLAGYAAAVRGWERTITSVEDRRRQYKVVFQRIVEPAVEVSARIPREALRQKAKSDLALMLARKAHMIRTDIEVRQLFKEKANETVYLAYQQASELHPTAEYLAGQGLAYSEWGEGDDTLTEVLRLSSAALELDQSYGDAYNLRGYGSLLSARQAMDPEQKKEFYKAAWKDFNAAIVRLKDKANSSVYTNRSTTYLELAFLMHKEFGKDLEYTRRLLKLAEQDADAAIQANPNLAALAWRAKGNALEDMALYLGEVKRYDDAEKAFYRARNQALDDPARDGAIEGIYLARCLLRKSRTLDAAGARDQLLKTATGILERTSRLKSVSQQLLARCALWKGEIETDLARLYPESASRHLQQAKQHFEMAAGLAEQFEPHAWPTYQLKLAMVQLEVDPNAACESAEQVIAQLGSHPTVTENDVLQAFGVCLRTLGLDERLDWIEKQLNQVSASAPDAKAIITELRLSKMFSLARQGDFSGVRAEASLVAELSREDQHRGRALVALGIARLRTTNSADANFEVMANELEKGARLLLNDYLDNAKTARSPNAEMHLYATASFALCQMQQLYTFQEPAKKLAAAKELIKHVADTDRNPIYRQRAQEMLDKL